MMPPAAPSAAIQRQRASAIGTTIFFAVAVVLLIDGWQHRQANDLTADSGMGYALGIVGGSMMLILLLYPLRKHWSAMRGLGAVKHWFRLHMALGVLGPIAVLYHCNFHFGALNSNIALVCMVVVASSGLMGRYFYAKIHHGLYGSQASLKELREESNLNRDRVVSQLHNEPRLQGRLLAFETLALTPAAGLLGDILRVLNLQVRQSWLYTHLWRHYAHALQTQSDDAAHRRHEIKQARRYLRAYLSATRRVAEFGLYTRLFALWHVLHLPLFFMMLVTGIVHVIAVHMY